MDVTPKIGMRFWHSFWLYSNGDPQACEITRIAKGVVYYRDIDRFQHNGQWLSSQLGSKWNCTIEQFPRYCRALLADGELP